MSFAIIQIQPFRVLKSIADTWVPDPVVWPSGEVSHGVDPGFIWRNWAFVETVFRPESPGEFYELTDTTSIFDGAKTVIYQRTWTAKKLETVKEALVKRLNDAAETQRQKYVTAGSVQSMVYQQKLTEAKTFATDRSPSAARYPLLSASVGTEARTLADVAALVTQAASQWIPIVAEIEKKRLSGKAAIVKALDVDSALQAFSSVTWSSRGQ